MWYAGIVFTFIIGAFLDYQGIAWASLIIPLIFFALFVWFPESPYYLIKKGKEDEAVRALMWLRGVDRTQDVEEELKEIKGFIQKDVDNRASWKDLLKTPGGRRALILVEIVMITALMGGLVTMLTYSSITFAQLSGNSLDPEKYTIIMGVLLLIIVPFTGLFLDKIGRRPVLLWSCFICFVCLIIAGVYSYLKSNMGMDLDGLVWLPFLVLIVYLIVLASGVEAVYPVLQGELFPSSTRAAASAILTLSLTAFSLLSLVIYQIVEEKFSTYLNFFIFAFFCAFGFVGVYFFLPETKGKTFSEIQELL